MSSSKLNVAQSSTLNLNKNNNGSLPALHQHLSTPNTSNINFQQIHFLEKGSNGQLPNGSHTTSYTGASSMTDSVSMGTSYNGGAGSSTVGSMLANSDSKKKLGHREVKHGVVLYKKVSTDELKKSIQFGIVHFLNEQNRRQMDRDLIMQDFQVVETFMFPKTGTSGNPPHSYNDFKLKVYAPYGFRYLRKKFNVNEVDFLHALGETDLKEVSNPGASGSVFYKTSNDKYILKTVQYQECEFLKTLLAGYTLNLLQNLINGKFSLLPTIYGLYCYQKMELTSMLSDKTNIRIVIMNNILPSDVPIHEKYDLKGSLYKRKASKQERAKSSPTYKDIDFLAEHPEGLMLDEKQYENIINSLKRDCLILESFGIMDYSMLLGIHNLEKERNNTAIEAYYEAKVGDPLPQAAQTAQTHSTLSAERANSTSNESVQPSTSSANQSVSSPMPSNYKSSMSSTSKSNWDNVFNMSAVPARSAKNERLLIYFGIIDILQSYRIKKRLEHAFKRLITDGDTVSVCPPDFYAKRFIDFMTQKVFKKATMKGSPVRKRLTFKLEKKEDQHQSLHSPVNSQFQLTTPLGTTTQKTFSPALQTNPTSPTNFKNFNQIKPIDSVDSVVGLMDSQQAGDNPNTTSLSKSYINSQSKKISNIEELADTESSLSETNKYTSNDNDNDNNNKKYFDNINNDNDTSRQGGGTNRAPITHIIKHYENKPHYLEEKKRSNSPLSTKSISMKLEPHSPTQLRSFRNYDREQHLPTSSSNNSPNKFNDTNKSIGVSYVSRNKRIILNNQPTSPLNDKHEFEIVTKL